MVRRKCIAQIAQLLLLVIEVAGRDSWMPHGEGVLALLSRVLFHTYTCTTNALFAFGFIDADAESFIYLYYIPFCLCDCDCDVWLFPPSRTALETNLRRHGFSLPSTAI